jgi:pimeloyl-ACP methyl ester carboxylesterase
VAPFILEGLLAHFEETVRKISTFAYSPKVSPELLERGVSLLLQCRPEVLHRDFLACDRFDLISDVGRIDLPTLIVCGAEDQLTPFKYSEFLHNHIQGARLEILPGAGHMVMIEAPEAFNERVGAFVREVL